MMHTPIHLNAVSLSFANKHCFDPFTCQIFSGQRIGIIGRNGCGKSSLLKILSRTLSPTSGQLIIPKGLKLGIVEQTIQEFNDLSGGQRLNKQLTKALSSSPDLLMLDEPTNHLDQDNRKRLLNMLNRLQHTLIIASHDTELLRQCVQIIWHIDQGKIHIFSGNFDDYFNTLKNKQQTLEKEIKQLTVQKKDTHLALMKEQKRAAKSKSKGQKSMNQRKWPTIVSHAKAARGQKTSGKKTVAISRKKEALIHQLENIALPEVILPKFSILARDLRSGPIIAISNACIGYSKNDIVLNTINLSLRGQERIALCGQNASGKSTLLKAILQDNSIYKTGTWQLPSQNQIGYLSQHYEHLDPLCSVFEHIQRSRLDWNDGSIRKHLNDFLFRKNEEVTQLVTNLSGGEKVRLSLSIIAAKTPRVLILDEITNNIDLETKTHVIQVLKDFPGALIIVSHEPQFLDEIGMDHCYTLKEGKLI